MRIEIAKNRVVASVALLFFLLVGWSVWSVALVDGSHADIISRRTASSTPIQDPATVVASNPVAGERTRSDAKPGVTSPQELPTSKPESIKREVCTLIVSGRDHLGAPLSHKLVALKRHPIVSSTHLDRADYYQNHFDKFGQVVFKDIPAGRWHIFNVTKFRSEMYEEVGIVDVAPNTEDRYSYQLRGWLTFSGAVRIAENDSVALSLRLIDPEGKIRFGMAFNGPEPKKFPIDAPNDDHPDNWKAHRPGGFEFSGLLPGRYKLEIILDIEERLKLFKEIDLVDKDIDIDYGRIPQSEWFKAVR